MNDDPSIVYYDMTAQTLRLRLSGGETLQLGDFRELSVRARDSNGTTCLPLFLSQEQAEVLSKMVRFILERQRITERSRELLASLGPRVDDIRDELELLSSAEEEPFGD
jgi:hypothetical protein